MRKQINFSGIAFEVGQSRQGLAHSTSYARKYFPTLKKNGLNLIDQGDVAIQDLDQQLKIFSDTDFKKIIWDKYKHAYLKTLGLLNKSAPLLNWGGDHSIALSTVGVFTFHCPDGFVIWIDAHADLNLPNKSLTGNFHGMPLAVLLNLEGIADDHFKWLIYTLDPKKLIYVGLRDIDPFELSVIKNLNIKTFSYDDILYWGMEKIAKEILDITHGHPLHISFDIDSVDPDYAPSTGVPVANGLSPKDLIIMRDHLFQYSDIRSVDVVEVNPMIGTAAKIDQTYLTAFDFLRSIFDNNYHGEIYDDMGEGNQGKYSSEMEWCL